MIRRALLAQMRYVADIATSLPSDVYSTSELFRLAWRSGRTQTLALVFIFLRQPVAVPTDNRRPAYRVAG